MPSFDWLSEEGASESWATYSKPSRHAGMPSNLEIPECSIKETCQTVNTILLQEEDTRVQQLDMVCMTLPHHLGQSISELTLTVRSAAMMKREQSE